MCDFKAARKRMPLQISKMLSGFFRADFEMIRTAIGNPVTQVQKNGIHSVLVLPHLAGWVQQLLKNLVVGRKTDLCRKSKIISPELQGIRHRLGSKRRSDDNLSFARFSAL